MRDPLTLTFNAPEDGSGEQSSWSRIWVARGGLAALVDDERLYQTIVNGSPIVLRFEDETEGRVLEYLISVMLKRRPRPAAALPTTACRRPSRPR
jgi:hypothetical protein